MKAKMFQSFVYWVISGTIAFNSNFIHQQQTVAQYGGAVYHYSQTEIQQQWIETKWCHYYYNFSLQNHYYDFILSSNQVLNKPASKQAKKNFDFLYDNRAVAKIWKNFETLNQTLTTTKLSEQVTLNLDWNQLYRQINLHPFKILNLDRYQLRFYNIMAKMYGVDNVLHLVQNIAIDEIMGYSKTDYYPKLSAIKFRFNSDFVNQKLIDENYDDQFWASNSPIITEIHEYAEALQYYVLNDEIERSEFNHYPIAHSDYQTKFQSTIQCFNDKEIFHDVTQTLIDFINQTCLVETNQDPVEKLLLPLLVVNSKFCRKAWIINNVHERDAFFAEAFARWIDTPDQKRNYNWELLNQYFMVYFPQHFGFDD